MHKKNVVGIVTFDRLTWFVYFPPTALLLMLQWHTGVYEETFYANSKIDQTTQNFKISLSVSPVYKKW